MKILSVFIAIILLLPGLGMAQRVELGLLGGVSNYSGELTPDYGIVLSESRPAVGGLLRYSPNNFLSLRFGISSAYISGTDENWSDPALQQRNLSFRSNIVEASFIAEINVPGYDVEMKKFSPYLFVGVAGFYHNPMALYQGEWIKLQPLGTEGQGTTAFPDRKPYSLYQAAIPFGVGTKFGLGSGLTLSAELGVRMTFTDYLDDISTTYVDPNILILENGELSYRLSNRTGELAGRDRPIDFGNNDPRGNPDIKDWYVIAGFTFTYTIGVPMSGSGAKEGCPVNW